MIPQAASLASTTCTQPSKHKTTTVELYLEPGGCVGVVDVLVEEGLNMDYSTPAPKNGGSDLLRSPEPWEGGHVTKRKTQKKLCDLPVISGNSLFMYDDCFVDEEPLPDLDNLRVKPKNDKGCGLEDSEDGHVTPPELLIGQEEEKSQTHQSVSPWQAFLNFCDEYL